jgi:hypothetical protein
MRLIYQLARSIRSALTSFASVIDRLIQLAAALLCRLHSPFNCLSPSSSSSHSTVYGARFAG